MSNKAEWLAWQKQVIREEYKDILPIRDKAQRQFDKTARKSLIAVEKAKRIQL